MRLLIQVLHRTVSIHSMKDGEMDECLMEQMVAYRQFTTQEIDLLAVMHGMEVSAMVLGALYAEQAMG